MRRASVASCANDPAELDRLSKAGIPGVAEGPNSLHGTMSTHPPKNAGFKKMSKAELTEICLDDAVRRRMLLQLYVVRLPQRVPPFR